MRVELLKCVDGIPAQRAWFAITRLADDAWHAEVTSRDQEGCYASWAAIYPVEEQASRAAHRRLIRYLAAFSAEELAGAEVTWETRLHAGTPPHLVDLADVVAAEVAEALAEEIEEREGEGRYRQAEPITLGVS